MIFFIGIVSENCWLELGQILVEATEGMVLENGQLMPVDVSNGTILTQIPAGVLKNAIETAGDMTQVQKSFIITGTEFGEKLDPMPRSINITMKGYNCSESLLYGSKLAVASFPFRLLFYLMGA